VDGPREPGCRVFLLTASMGGGHEQVCRELARRLRDRGCEVRTADLLALMPGPAARFLRWVYPGMVNRAPWLYQFVYERFFLADQRDAARGAVPVRLAIPGLRRALREWRPDVVVSTYHLAGVAAARLRASGELDAPVVTFVTTFGVHRLWLHRGTDLYLCITEWAARRLSATGPGRVRVCEPVVRAQFLARSPGGRRPGRPALRLPPGGRLALVAAGSLGLGPVADAARTVGALPGWHAVVVCGRNDRLRARLAGEPGVTALPWVEDMAALMAAADVVIDNAAGSTAKEALALGVPVLTYRPISGHGRDDALMMEAAGVARVVTEPAELRSEVAALTDPSVRSARIRAGRALFGTDPVDAILEVALDPRHDLAAA
jgi:UDP-N-acetylglucosamine:LPS N-acetylglucosamine transferase